LVIVVIEKFPVLAKQLFRSSLLFPADLADLFCHTSEIVAPLVCEFSTELSQTLAHLLLPGDDRAGFHLTL